MPFVLIQSNARQHLDISHTTSIPGKVGSPCGPGGPGPSADLAHLVLGVNMVGKGVSCQLCTAIGHGCAWGTAS